MDAQTVREKLLLFPNQAVSIYDFTSFQLKYANGFEIFGLDNANISLSDIFNTAELQHREVCVALSGNLISFEPQHSIVPVGHALTMNFAAQHRNGWRMHILFQAKVLDSPAEDTFKSLYILMTYLPHLRPPNIVSWSVHGPLLNRMHLHKSLVGPNHIGKRELQVLQLTAAGHSMLKISVSLNISDRTVEKHLENMRHRFNCQNSKQLVAFAKDMDLL